MEALKPMKTYQNDPNLLTFLQTCEMPVLTRQVFDAKFAAMSADPDFALNIGLARNRFAKQRGWCGAMAIIVRNAPDDRGKVTTVLPNVDTLAALLAVRLGINMHLAVALAYEDVIEAWAVRDGRLEDANIAPEGSIVLATFTRRPEAHTSLVLTARNDARAFALRFRPEELMLLDQHSEVGLHNPFRTSYFDEHLSERWAYRTDEAIERFAVPSREAMKALSDELSAFTFQHCGDRATAEREMRRQLQATIDKHLGNGVCLAGVSINGGPVRIDLGE